MSWYENVIGENMCAMASLCVCKRESELESVCVRVLLCLHYVRASKDQGFAGRVDVTIVIVLPCFSVSFILFISFIVPSLSMQQWATHEIHSLSSKPNMLATMWLEQCKCKCKYTSSNISHTLAVRVCICVYLCVSMYISERGMMHIAWTH